MRILRRLAGVPAGPRTKWLALLLWIAAAVVFGSLAGKLAGAEKNDAGAFLPAGAESTQVFKLQQQHFSTGVSLAVLVYENPGGITADDRARAKADMTALEAARGVKGKAEGPKTADDGKALEVLIPVDDLRVVEFGDDVHDKILKNEPAGLSVHLTGQAGAASDQFRVYQSIDGITAAAAGIVVIVMLLLIYRSPFLWFLPMLSVVLGFAISEGVLYLLAAHAGLTVNAQTAGILPVLVFGVGTDYALLLIARYREELHQFRDRHQAMRVALRRAAPAILASAATVAFSMLCLLLAELNSTKGFGPAFAIGVVLALAVMVTLLPALLVIMPRGVFWPRVPRFDPAREQADASTLVMYEREHGFWARVARTVDGRPRLIWTATAGLLVLMTLGLGTLNLGGLSAEGQFISKPDSVIGQAVLARHFPGGSGAPAFVVGRAPDSAALQQAIAGTPGVVADQVAAAGTSGGYVQYTAVLADRSDSPAAIETVKRLRAAVHPVGNGKVGGPTAQLVDTRAAAAHDNRVIIPVVLAVVFLILILLLRAIVAPVLMIATVALSFLASLGFSAFLFDQVFGFEGEDAAFPVAGFLFLVALGVDYNIFLMTRVKEESRRHGAREGVLRGLTVTGGVITSAGLVLAATFAALTILPIVGTVELGFLVAFGVLADTIIVRSLLLPALSIDVGRRIWWPGRLARAAAGPSTGDRRRVEQVRS